jgi:hypothetical protein
MTQPEKSGAEKLTSIASNHPVPNLAEILDVLRVEAKLPAADSSLFKIQFVIANGLYRNLGLNEKDPQWSAFVKSEEFCSAIRENTVTRHHAVLDYLKSMW